VPDLQCERAHAGEFAVGGSEVELVRGHGLCQPNDFAFGIAQLSVKDLFCVGRGVGGQQGHRAERDYGQRSDQSHRYSSLSIFCRYYSIDKMIHFDSQRIMAKHGTIGRFAVRAGMSRSAFLTPLLKYGLEAEQQKCDTLKQKILHYRDCADPAEADRLGNEIGEMIFGQ